MLWWVLSADKWCCRDFLWIVTSPDCVFNKRIYEIDFLNHLPQICPGYDAVDPHGTCLSFIFTVICLIRRILKGSLWPNWSHKCSLTDREGLGYFFNLFLWSHPKRTAKKRKETWVLGALLRRHFVEWLQIFRWEAKDDTVQLLPVVLWLKEKEVLPLLFIPPRCTRCKCVHTAVSWRVVSWVTRSQGIPVTSSKEALDTVDLKCKCGQRKIKYWCLAEDIKIVLAKTRGKAKDEGSWWWILGEILHRL